MDSKNKEPSLLSITPSSDASNIYTIFGDSYTGADTSSAMIIPAGYQEPAPFGANTGVVSAAQV